MLIEYPNTDYDTLCSLVDAETLILNNIPTAQHTGWDALVDTDKEILLRQSTLLIKNKITLPNTLEADLKLATAYLANSSVSVDMTANDGKDNVKVKEIVGVVKTEFFSKSEDSNNFPDIVTMLLNQYQISSTGSSIRFSRA